MVADKFLWQSLLCMLTEHTHERETDEGNHSPAICEWKNNTYYDVRERISVPQYTELGHHGNDGLLYTGWVNNLFP